MSKLSALMDDAKVDLSVQERIPETSWNAIADQGGPLEVPERHSLGDFEVLLPIRADRHSA
ncbi:hypothetical protein [Massilia sp. DWR3-1-1]|uniref:hypothetical protein n=1 Tax=Massilia sp. DWR3-1-1 TaxID=2804559 RepID=UPI003CEB9910